jgi:hypothetical protein
MRGRKEEGKGIEGENWREKEERVGWESISYIFSSLFFLKRDDVYVIFLFRHRKGRIRERREKY